MFYIIDRIAMILHLTYTCRFGAGSRATQQLVQDDSFDAVPARDIMLLIVLEKCLLELLPPCPAGTKSS